MKVQDVMTSPAHSCFPDASLATAARTMSDYGCGALPVLDDRGRPTGILTELDISRAVAPRDRSAGKMRVREAMTPNPATCSPETPLAESLQIMAERKIGRLPVVDAEGRLVGIVSLSDIVSAIQESKWTASPSLRRLLTTTPSV